jgi:ABC-type sugar transport system substrate-binding protein
MPKVDRRHFIKTASVAGLIGTAGCVGSSGGGSSNQKKKRKIGISQHRVGGAWVTAFLDAGKWYCKNQPYTCEVFTHNQSVSKQIKDIRQMANQDYDGIVVVPWSQSVNTGIKAAANSGVPVFTVDKDIKSSFIKTYTSFGNYNAGKKGANLLAKALKNQNPNKSTYEILNVRGPFNSYSNARTKGFVETINKSQENIKILETIKTDWSRAVAKQKTLQWLTVNSAPDGVFSSNVTSGLGVFAALKQQGLIYPQSNDKHIVLTQLDGSPNVNPKIGKGFIDAAVDQPNYFYIPLALRQLERFWQNGDEALPDPGTKIGKNDINIKSDKHEGVQLWSKPIWAPAKVIEKNKHIKVETDSIIITKENADAPYLWGNIWEKNQGPERTP